MGEIGWPAGSQLFRVEEQDGRDKAVKAARRQIREAVSYMEERLGSRDTFALVNEDTASMTRRALMTGDPRQIIRTVAHDPSLCFGVGFAMATALYFAIILTMVITNHAVIVPG